MQTVDVQTLETVFQANFAKYDAALRRYENNSERAANRVERAFREANDSILKSTRGLQAGLRNGVATLLSVETLRRGVSVVAEFGANLSTLSSITKATGADLQALEDRARALGASTDKSASQASEAMIALGRAGFSTGEILDAIDPVLFSSQATGASLAEVAQVASRGLNGFGLAASDASVFLDQLVFTANNSDTTITSLGEALKFAAPTARALGLSVEETVAIIAKLGDAGLQGGLAGRGFASFATSLEKERDRIEELIGEFDLQSEGLASVIRRLTEAGITTPQVIALFKAENLDLFTTISEEAVNATDGIDAFNAALGDASGTARETAAVATDNLKGAFAQVISATEELILAFSELGAESALKVALEQLAVLLRLASENADIVAFSITALTIRSLLPMAVTVGGKVSSAILAFNAHLAATNAIAAKQVTALSLSRAGFARLLVALGPATIALGALTGAYILFSRASRSAFGGLDQSLSRLSSVNGQLDEDQRTRAALTKDLTDLLEREGEAAEIAARRELAALDERIAKRKELAGLLESEIRLQLADAEAELERLSSANFITRSIERGSGEARRLRTDVRQSEGLNAFSDDSADTDRLFQERLDAEVESIHARQDSGEALTKAERNLLAFVSRRVALEERLLGLREQVAELAPAAEPSSGFGGALDILTGLADDAAAAAPTGPTREELVVRAREVERVLSGIDSAFRKSFETERAEIARVRDERIAAIEESGRSAAEQATLRAQAEAIAADQITQIEDKEASRRAAAQAKEMQIVEREIGLLRQLEDARDRASGNTQAVEDRAFEGERQKIEDTISDEGRRTEALNALDDRRAAEQRAAAQEQADFEKSLIADLVDARDQAAGNALAIAQREFDRRREFIELEVEDVARRNEALALLEEERAEFERQAVEELDQYIQAGSDDRSPAMEEFDRIREEQQHLIELLADLEQQKILTAQEAAARRVEIERAAAAQIADVQRQQFQVAIKSAESTFGEIGRIVAGFAGEQSTAARVLFGIQKAFAIADATIKIQQGIASALSLPFPANLAAAAGVASQAGVIISTISGTSFGGGRRLGGPVRPDQFYEVTEGGVPELLRQGNRTFLLPGSAGRVEPLSDRLMNGAPIAGGRSSAEPVEMTNNIFNSAADRVQARTVQNDSGGLDVIIEAIRSDINGGGGPISGAIESQYGVTRGRNF